MRGTYRNLQIIKHALQYYISRPNANEKDLAREKSLLERIEDEVEYYQKAYHIPKKEVEIMDIKEQMKEIMDASVTCDKCNHEFVIKEESIMKEKMEVKGLKFDLIYFYCPKCKKIYRASIQDRKYYLLVEELDKVRKQVRNNFGTFDTTKANKLNKKLKKKSNALKNHVLEMNDKFSGEFAFFVDNKENRTIEYIENDDIN